MQAPRYLCKLADFQPALLGEAIAVVSTYQIDLTWQIYASDTSAEGECGLLPY